MIGTAGQLTGVVTDSTTTRPIGGAQVSLLRSGRYRSAVTQANGRYWIIQVPDDSYTVTTRHSGYALQAHQEVSVVADSTIRIDFQLVPNTQGH
ncbi:MAG: carboxypeptidase regulatory-like domain-containing protein [Gemmatimonadaceae bacterium]|nr:carboxypeptidase regulatory-like domain-containing protein [Gemmatimonadaceae bacterium]